MAIWQRVPYSLLLHLWYHVGNRSCGGQGSSQSSGATGIRQHGFHSWIVASDACPHIPQGVYVVILDSGFCVLKAIIELRKKGIFASALIKKRQYWPKFICGDDIKAHFDGKEVGATDSWAGKLDDIPFHVYAMKEPDYVMSLMSTYGTNNRDNGKETRRNWKVGGEARSTLFRYPEAVHNHFLYRHAVDAHNGKRHSPISLEVVWATKRWPNRVFAFLMSVTEVNCYLAESYFTSRKSNSMLDFQKSLSHQLIENEYFDQEAESQHRRSTRIQEGIEHRLMSLPPYKNVLSS